MGGRRQDGTWSRGTIYDPFTFTSYLGEKVLLSPGQTWVHVPERLERPEQLTRLNTPSA